MAIDESKHPDSPLTRIIIGCAMKVHAGMGNELWELIYWRTLSMELKMLE
jgi:PD-(D/E)XK nuclease superfamily